MMFLLRALFWIAVVAAFVPPGLNAAGTLFASEAEQTLSPAAEQLAVRARTDTSTFCNDHAELCRAADNARAFAGLAGGMAASAAQDWLAERDDAASDESHPEPAPR